MPRSCEQTSTSAWICPSILRGGRALGATGTVGSAIHEYLALRSDRNVSSTCAADDSRNLYSWTASAHDPTLVCHGIVTKDQSTAHVTKFTEIEEMWGCIL